MPRHDAQMYDVGAVYAAARSQTVHARNWSVENTHTQHQYGLNWVAFGSVLYSPLRVYIRIKWQPL